VALSSIEIQDVHADNRFAASGLAQLQHVDFQLTDDAGHGQEEGLERGDAFKAVVA
jgi:hypothetical protein